MRGMANPSFPSFGAGLDPLEEVLRCCADAAPDPWYPRDYAKRLGIPLAELAADVEHLWLEGLLQPVARPGDPVPGLVLTEAGARVLDDPEALDRLRAGLPLGDSRAAAARHALRAAGRPRVSRALLWISVLIFAIGFIVAWRWGAGQAFLAGTRTFAAQQVLHRSGSVSAEDVIDGQSWRLLTAAFVHVGLLHLLMNASMLVFGGALAEAMWGRARYLLIYLVAAFGGSCLAVARQAEAVFLPGPGGVVQASPLVAGASGALCGVLAAAAVWLGINGRHLPWRVAWQLRTGLISSGLLLAFISLFPRVSGVGHLGGALFGAAAALLLHVQRWGPTPWRWLATLGVVALPWLGWAAVERTRAHDAPWHQAEQRVYDRRYRSRAATALDDAGRLYERRVAPLLEMPPRRRDPASVERLLPEMDERRRELFALADALTAAGFYRNPETEKQRATALEAARDRAGQFADAEQILRRNANSAARNEVEELAFTRQFLSRIPGTMGAAIRLWQGEVEPLLKIPPDRRDRRTVERALTELETRQRELATLAEDLQQAGPYGNEEVEPARHAAERYAAARAALLQAAMRCLRAGDRWAPADEAALRQQADAVKALRGEWEQRVER